MCFSFFGYSVIVNVFIKVSLALDIEILICEWRRRLWMLATESRLARLKHLTHLVSFTHVH